MSDNPEQDQPNTAPEQNTAARALEALNPAGLARLSEHIRKLLAAKLWLQVLIGMFLGMGVGYMLNPENNLVSATLGNTLAEWLALPGYFFLAIIQMIIVPLVFASVIRGVAANQSIDQLRKTGARLIVYFLITTIFSVTIGLGLGLLLKPGEKIDIAALQVDSEDAALVEGAPAEAKDVTIADIPGSIISIFPENPLNALVSAEMLQVVVFAIVVALALVNLAPKTAKPILELLGSTEAVAISIVRWAMLLAPWAVFGLLARTVSQTGLEVMIGLGWYVGAALLGFVVLIVFYMLIVAILGRRNPITFLGHIRETMLVAFSMDSSAAAMPVTIETAEKKLKIKPSTARFVIPLGATINMDSTAMIQGLATVFLAQLSGFDLATSTLIAVLVTIVGASIGTPGAPSMGILILASVLGPIGVPLDNLALIIGIDRILSMMRGGLNVTGDLVATTVMDRLRTGQTAEEEAAAEAERDVQRATTGSDVVEAPATA